MIIVKNRELLIPAHERYIGTPIDNYADNRIFKIKRFSQSGEDLSGLTFRLDLKYPTERTVYTFARSTTHTGGSVSVLSKTFVKAYPNAGTYTFSFDGTKWKRSSNAVDFEEIGVVINFTPVSGDTISVVSTISNVSGNVVLLEKEIGDNEINLIWHITENDTAIPGTVFVALRGSDGDATVRYASYYAALYVDANLDQTALPASGITELEQLENMAADQLRKMEYLYNRYKDLDIAAQDAEAWAKGTRNGHPVSAGDDTYQNNAKYYSDLREGATHLAEAWARGTRDGVDLPEGETGYHDNAKYWKIVSEGWAHGGTGTHTNEQTDNSKYWSEVSHAYANQVSYKKVYANVAEMVADTELIDGQVVRTIGYYAVNDGGGALYRIYSAAPATYYETLANGLYAELITNGTVRPEQFGAKGDGSTDDTTAVQRAVNSGCTVRLLEKTYKVGTINAVSGTEIEGSGENSKLLVTYSLYIKQDNVNVRNLSIYSSGTNVLISVSGTSSDYIEHTNISNVHFYYSSPTGSEISIAVDYAKDFNLSGCVVDVGGVLLLHIDRYTIKGCVFDGKHLNTNESIHSSIYTQYGEISGNYFKGLHYEAIDTFSSGNRLLICDNVFDDFEIHVIDIKVVLRDPPYTGGSSDQPAYGFTEYITVRGNIILNFVPRITSAKINIVQCYVNDERSSPAYSNAEIMRCIIIDGNQFVNMYPQDNVLAPRVVYRCISVLGFGINVSNNVFSKLYTYDNQYENAAIMVGSERTTGYNLTVCPSDVIITGNVISSTQSGVILAGCINVSVTNNAFITDERDDITCKSGIVLLKDVKKLVLTGNIFKVQDYGIRGYLSTGTLEDAVISNNIFYKGVSIKNAKRTQIVNNAFYETAISFGNDTAYSSEQSIISGNTFHGDGTGYVIFAYNASGLLVNGNTAENFDTFIRLLKTSKYCQISNNICKNIATFKNIGSVDSGLETTITDVNNVTYSS